MDLPAEISVVLKSGLLSYTVTLKPLCASLNANKLPHNPAPTINILSFLFIYNSFFKTETNRYTPSKEVYSGTGAHRITSGSRQSVII